MTKPTALKPQLKRNLLGAALALTLPGLYAQGLADLYDAARGYDAAYQAARAQAQSAIHRAEQSKAGLYPTVGLSGNYSYSDVDNSLSPIRRSFNSRGATLSASQPLYRPLNWLNAEQGERQLEASRAQLISAQQELLVRVTQAYFDVLASQDSLTFVKAQKTAVAEQLAAARRNFEVGTSTITDTREAQARFDLVVAQEIAADNDLRIKRLALDQLVGKTGTTPKALATPVKLPELTPADVNAWVTQSEAQHPSIRVAQTNLELATLETQKAQAGHKPTLDLQASMAHSRSSGSASSNLASRNNTASAALVFNLPLFAGFGVQSRIQETLQLEEKARNDLEAAKRTVAQATRTAFFGVLSGQGQVKALEAAELSSQSALDANRLGYQVGVRINIDVLNAQSQLFQTKRDLAKARYDVLVGSLKLRQANGTLKPEDIHIINALITR